MFGPFPKFLNKKLISDWTLETSEILCHDLPLFLHPPRKQDHHLILQIPKQEFSEISWNLFTYSKALLVMPEKHDKIWTKEALFRPPVPPTMPFLWRANLQEPNFDELSAHLRTTEPPCNTTRPAGHTQNHWSPDRRVSPGSAAVLCREPCQDYSICGFSSPDTVWDCWGKKQNMRIVRNQFILLRWCLWSPLLQTWEEPSGSALDSHLSVWWRLSLSSYPIWRKNFVKIVYL